VADKEHACANRSEYFVNQLRNDSIASKDLFAKADLKNPWLYMSTSSADH